MARYELIERMPTQQPKSSQKGRYELIGEVGEGETPSKEKSLTESILSEFGTTPQQVKGAASGLGRGIGKGTEELFNIPLNIAEYLGEHNVPFFKQVAEPLSKKIRSYEPEFKTSGQPAEVVGDLLTALAVPEAKLGKLSELASKSPYFGKYFSKALEQAAPQAAVMAGESLPEGGEEAGKAAGQTAAMMAPFSIASTATESLSPTLRKLGKLGTMAGSGFVGREIGEETGMGELSSDAMGLVSAMLSQKGIRPKKYAEKELKSLVENVPKEEALQKTEAAKRLGLSHVTPAEVFDSPAIAQKEASYGRTPEGSSLLYQRGENRLKQEDALINRFMDDLYTSEMAPEKKAAYKESMSKTVPQEFFDKQLDNPVIQDAVKTIENTPAYRQKMKDVPIDSLEYWDRVKRILGQQESRLRGKEGMKDLANEIGEVRRSMVDELDEIAPSYKEAREIAGRGKARETIDKIFDKNDISGKSFYKSLKSDKKFDDIMKDLKKYPDLQNRLKDMRTVFKGLISAPTPQTAAGKERTAMTQMRNPLDAAKNLANSMFFGAHDRAFADLVTSDKWIDIVKRMKKADTEKGKAQIFIDALSKGAGQYSSKDMNES